MNRLRAWLKEWPEGLWLLVLAAALYAGLKWAAYYAPNAGLEGFENVVALLPGLIQGFAITGAAWLCKRTYTRDHDDEAEDALWHEVFNGNPFPLFLDTLQWAGWIGLWYALLR